MSQRDLVAFRETNGNIQRLKGNNKSREKKDREDWKKEKSQGVGAPTIWGTM